MKYFLGIDTSCYTTSVAVVNQDNELVADSRKPLVVKPGKRGLSQSEMVFQHTKNLPAIMEEISDMIGSPLHFEAIGVSSCPRPLPESYMPAFLVGDGFARSLAAIAGSKLIRISHQEGHIYAGIWSAKGPNSPEFLAVHVSGGTTEVVAVNRILPEVEITLVGGSTDLHAGQFVDRIGVALALPFPAGPHLERLAKAGKDKAARIPEAVKGLSVSFSGPETHALRLLAQGYSSEEIAAGVERCIAVSLAKLIENAVDKTGLREVLLVGGVNSNQFVRSYITDRLLKSRRAKIFLPHKKYSPDNAVGTAYFAFLYSTCPQV